MAKNTVDKVIAIEEKEITTIDELNEEALDELSNGKGDDDNE